MSELVMTWGGLLEVEICDYGTKIAVDIVSRDDPAEILMSLVEAEELVRAIQGALKIAHKVAA